MTFIWFSIILEYFKPYKCWLNLNICEVLKNFYKNVWKPCKCQFFYKHLYGFQYSRIIENHTNVNFYENICVVLKNSTKSKHLYGLGKWQNRTNVNLYENICMVFKNFSKNTIKLYKCKFWKHLYGLEKNDETWIKPYKSLIKAFV